MDTYQWTLAAEQNAATWIAVSGSSLPYNLAHVIGNVVFCLLIGPALLRALSRYRRRFEVRWAPAAAASAGALLLLLVALPATAPAVVRRARDGVARQGSEQGRGLRQRRPDRPRASSSPAGPRSAWPRADATRATSSAAATARSTSSAARPRDIREVGEVERTILVLESAGLSARGFAGRDFVARLERFRRANGSFSNFVSYTAFGILALRAAGSGGTGESASWLAGQQNADGGFGLAPGAQSDVDNTGAAIQALAAAGRRGPVPDAVDYLRSAQNDDGGFGQFDGRSSNAQSTAYAVQGLVAAGRNPGRFRKSGRSPIAYLRARQNGDGSVDYSSASSQTPVWVTAQAVMALRRKPLPIDAGGARAGAIREPPRRAMNPAAERARTGGTGGKEGQGEGS